MQFMFMEGDHNNDISVVDKINQQSRNMYNFVEDDFDLEYTVKTVN